VPEITDDGVTGFIVDGVDAAVRAVSRLGELGRSQCGDACERRFTAGRMADGYVDVYRKLARRLGAILNTA